MESKSDSITILIPAFNESQTIQDTVAAVKGIGRVTQILVIDDCSTDNTAELAKNAGAEVISLAHNVGKGGALNQGIQSAKGDIIGMLDGDLGRSASEVEKLITPVLEQKADMTIAKFPPAVRKGGFGIVTILAKKGIRMLTGLEVSSPLSGQRVIRRSVLDAIGPFEARFGVEVGLTIDAFRHGFRVKEVPVQMTHAETGRDFAGFLHRGRQFSDVLLVLFKRLVSR